MCFFPITLGDSLQNTCIIKSNCTITLHGHFQYNFRMVIPMSKFVVWWQKDKGNDMQYNTRERERGERRTRRLHAKQLEIVKRFPVIFSLTAQIQYIHHVHCRLTLRHNNVTATAKLFLDSTY